MNGACIRKPVAYGQSGNAPPRLVILPIMPRSMAQEQDILKLPAPKRPPRLTSRRIGIHTSSAGGVQNAAERAYRLGCNTFQIFSSSPRQWAPYELSRPQCERDDAPAREVRPQADGHPRELSGESCRHHAAVLEEIDRSVSRRSGTRPGACAPNTWCFIPVHFAAPTRSGTDANFGRNRRGNATDFDLAKGKLTILIENTAGAEYLAGRKFRTSRRSARRLRDVVPIAACIDTCHTHVAGYDIVSEAGMRQTLAHLDETVGLKNVSRLALQRCQGRLADQSSTGISTSGREVSAVSRFAGC